MTACMQMTRELALRRYVTPLGAGLSAYRAGARRCLNSALMPKFYTLNL